MKGKAERFLGLQWTFYGFGLRLSSNPLGQSQFISYAKCLKAKFVKR